MSPVAASHTLTVWSRPPDAIRVPSGLMAALAANALQVEYATVWELLPAGQALRVRAAVGWPAEAAGYPPGGTAADSQAGFTLLCGGPVITEDVRTEARFCDRALADGLGAVSGLSVVIPGAGRPFGVLAAHSTRPRGNALEDVYFLQALANMLAEEMARRRAEEALRASEQFRQAILDALAAQIAVLGPQGEILAVNEGWRRFAAENGGGADCGTGVSYLDVCRRAAEAGCADAALVLRGLEGVLGGTLLGFAHEYPCDSPSQERWFLLRATPCAAGPGGAVVAHLDLTQRKRAERELQEADRRKGDLVALLAHELRNPLVPLLNGLHILRMRGVDPTTVEGVQDMMERQVRHLTRLTDDLLDVCRVERGRLELRKEVVDVATLVSRAMQAVRPLAEGRRHEMDVSLPAEPLRLEADPTRLEQVLFNLLHNAVEFTEPGGHIGLTAVQEGDEVVLRVRDTGVGISAAMLPRVFEMFVQGEGRPNSSQGGLGVGLALVRQLVEMHGGSVQATSEGPGRGSEFVVRLPALA